jgi:decaprenyl-phosphate phosphoribosyltransferase
MTGTTDQDREPAVRAGGQPQGTTLEGMVKAVRPRQWVKNLLVLAAPVLSGQAGDGPVLAGAAIAFVAFSLAASGIYLVNDVRDVEEDRRHPKKQHRPIAAGVVSPFAAVATAIVLLTAAPLIGLLATTQLTIVVLVYEGLSLLYCLALKDEPVIDIAIVASGFLLRAIAGGAATDISLSQWFLLAASFGSLFMASGKRYAEARAHGDSAETRKSLVGYTQTYLRFVWTMSASVLIMTYGLWAFEEGGRTGSVFAAISVAPFVLAVLRYAVDVDAGKADAPEEIALGDRVLQVLAVLWLATVVAAVYV